MCETNSHFSLVVPGVHAADHQTNVLDERKQTRAVGDHEVLVETGLPEWLQPLTEGWTRGSSSSTDVLPADVSIPAPAILPSVVPPTKPTSNKSGGQHKLFTHFPGDANCKVCRRAKVTRTPCKINPDDPTDRLKIADRFGDVMTANHKVLDEEQESRLHHRYSVVVQDHATITRQQAKSPHHCTNETTGTPNVNAWTKWNSRH